MPRARRSTLLLAAAVAALLAVAVTATLVDRADGGDSAAAGTPIPQPTRDQLAAAGLDELPLAPEEHRVDLVAPPFTKPTEITNPLFPIADLPSAILAGIVDDKSFKTETTLLPQTRFVEIADGRIVEALVSQYVAYLDGRLEEVALDFYAQADDGSVWYLGEDVFNYDEGLLADLHGTWLAGKEGPAAMIMPADPSVGDVYRPENIAGLVFEEVTVKTLDETVAGPSGPVEGALVVRELHDDGSFEEKVFAPGYGEFFTASDGDVEAMALAVPADALSGPPPAELQALSRGADRLFLAGLAGRWTQAATVLDSMTAAWQKLRAGQLPPRLETRMSSALAGLAEAVGARDRLQTGHAAIDVADAALDLELRHRPPAEIDLARFELWTRQILVDAAADDLEGVAGDVAVLEWIRDRFVHTLGKVEVTRLDAALEALRASVGDEDVGAAAETAEQLEEVAARIELEQ